MSNNGNKVKVLLTGRIDTAEQAAILCRKVLALHRNVKAGPFDLVLGCCGTRDALDALLLQRVVVEQSFPRLYLQDTAATASFVQTNACTTQQQQLEEGDSSHEEPQDDDASSPCCPIGSNIYVLRDKTNTDNDEPQAGIWSLPIGSSAQLVVASLPPQFRIPTATAINDPNNDTTSSRTTTTINSNSSNNTTKLLNNLTHVSYTGCDFLLSTEWPQGIETILPTTTASSAPPPLLLSSFDVADVALKARARYHVAFLHDHSSLFQQSPAFRHCSATTSTVPPQHAGRFLALCPVSQDTTKTRKYLHAVGVVPLHQQALSSSSSSGENSASWLPCPYTDAVYPMDHPTMQHNQQQQSLNVGAGAVGLSDAAARRILHEDRQRATSATDRWAVSSKRARQPDDEPVDPHNCTLFVHGLHMDVTGRLQREDPGNALLLQVLQPFQALHVRRPVPSSMSSSSQHTTAFVFVEFATHAQARECLHQTGGRITVQGVPLMLKWATKQNKDSNSAGKRTKLQQHHHRLLEAEARDSSTLYFKLTLDTHAPEVTLPPLISAGQVLRLALERTLERALAGDDDDGNSNDPPLVQAADEPALQVQVRFPSEKGESEAQRNFGFLDFASHAAASMALATLTGSTDGGRVLEEPQDRFIVGVAKKETTTTTATATTTTATTSAEPVSGTDNQDGTETKAAENTTDNTSAVSSATGPLQQQLPLLEPQRIGIYLHWAQARIDLSAAERRERDMIEDDSRGFRFRRQHFPPDSRQDCWFCLASESCETHLITGVYQYCYAALPKGPVHPGHVLLVPVQHSRRGALLLPEPVVQELEHLKSQLRLHAARVYDCDLFVFERALPTRGGYHTHVQCVPVARQLGRKLQTTLLAQATKIGMEMREINADVAIVRTILADQDESNRRDPNGNGDDEDDDVALDGSGYFYAEIPGPSGDYKRFLYKASDRNGTSNSNNRCIVPLQLGREVLAAVLAQPELAHWKSCVLDREQEEILATNFRASVGQQANNPQPANSD